MRYENVIIAVFFVLFLTVCFPVYAKETQGQIKESIPRGFINWSERRIYVMGVGAPDPGMKNIDIRRLDAEKTAMTTMKRNFISAIRKIRIFNKKTIGEELDFSELSSLFSNLQIKDFYIASRDYYSNGSVNILASLPLASVFMRLGEKITTPYDSKIKPIDKTVVSEGSLHVVVIDATDFTLDISILTTIMSSEGNVVLSPEMYSSIGNQIFPSYVSSFDFVKSLIGDDAEVKTVTPIKIRKNGTIVISEDDSREIILHIERAYTDMPRFFILTDPGW